MATYITKDGDTVDYIVWEYYETTANRTVEQVLNANPGLADQGAILPAGLRVILPDLPVATETTGVKLWD